MARLIQSAIKTPLAEEVLFGKLKNGGTVSVVVVEDDTGTKKLGFEFPEGPATPRPEVVPASAPRPVAKAKKPATKKTSAKSRTSASAAPKGGTVPKVPLKG
jgi:ATP-dependent Clp protease ATP-binding subunit ClpA